MTNPYGRARAQMASVFAELEPGRQPVNFKKIRHRRNVGSDPRKSVWKSVLGYRSPALWTATAAHLSEGIATSGPHCPGPAAIAGLRTSGPETASAVAIVLSESLGTDR